MKTTPTKNNTLEQLAATMPGKDLAEREAKVHTALLLAFYSALHTTVGRNVLPTPLFRVHYDHRMHHLDFEDLEGIAPVPNGESYTISSLDAIFACHARDIPLIFEGDTGTGKTLTTETYFRTILPESSFVVMSLSHQSMTDSPKSPFERFDRTELQVHLDRDNLRRIAAMYIDELNLGNTSDLLQLSYGRVLCSKERGIAGILTPILTEQGVEESEEYLKRLWVSGSQNPPKSRDAQFTGMELSASLRNRFLLLEYPRILKSVGSSIWLVDQENGLHPLFKEALSAQYQQLTGQPLEMNDQDWLGVYAYTLNAKRTEKAIIRSSLEFSDLLMMVLSGNLEATYKQEQEHLVKWKARLPAEATSNFELTFTIDDTVELQQLNAILGSFDKPLTERDDAYLKNLADLFATIRGLQKAYRSKDPLQAYRSMPSYVTVEDVAAAATLLARNKQLDVTHDPIRVVNATLNQYVALMNGLARDIPLKDYPGFSAEDRDLGLKEAVYRCALEGASSALDICKDINGYVGKLKKLGNRNDLCSLIIARTVADLATTSGFIYDHQVEIDQHLQKRGNTSVATARGLKNFIYDLYQQEVRNPTVNPIYLHRLPRVL